MVGNTLREKHGKERNLRHVRNELIMRVWTTFDGELRAMCACDGTGLSVTWISNSKKKNNEERTMRNSEI